MNDKISLLSGGGLGDACISFAKLSSAMAPFPFDKSKIVVTHMLHKGTDEVWKAAVFDFYSSQGIVANAVVVPSWKDSLNPSNFDYVLEGGWSGKGANDECACWEINPFPEVILNFVEGVDILLIVAAGNRNDRKFSYLDVSQFVDSHKDRKIILSGYNIKENNYFKIGGDNCDNQINKFSTKNLVDIIGSSNVVIANNGFVTYLAGMMRKKVYYTSDGIGTTGNMHPKWNSELIRSLSDIRL